MLQYVTTNEGKVREAREYLTGVIDVEATAYDYLEVQAHDLETIAERGARDAHDELDSPVLVDDAGLFVDALAGFPGPYSAFVEETLGVQRVADLGTAEPDPSAAFECVLAYAEGPDGPAGLHDPGVDRSVAVETFSGTVRGRIVQPRGDGGFGYDPIFEYGDRTFAELPTVEKNTVSHRGRALEAFADWLTARIE